MMELIENYKTDVPYTVRVVTESAYKLIIPAIIIAIAIVMIGISYLLMKKYDMMFELSMAIGGLILVLITIGLGVYAQEIPFLSTTKLYTK